LLTLPNRHPTPKLRSFIDHVVTELGQASATASARRTRKAC